MTAHPSMPIERGAGPGGRFTARTPQSMRARPPLSAAWLESIARAAGEADRVRVEHAGARLEFTLFFITGFPRSGTHWVGSLLNLHPEVLTDGEFFFDALLEGHERLAAWKWLVPGSDAGHRALGRRCFEDSVRRMLSAIAERRPSARLIGDRTPRPLTIHLPGARHIVVARDGRDVLVSWTFHQLRTGGRDMAEYLRQTSGSGGLAEARDAFARDPRTFEAQPERLLADEGWVRRIARRWAEQRRHDMDTIERIRRGELDASVLEVGYERLHAAPGRILHEMLAFLGADARTAAPLDADSGTLAGATDGDPRSFFRSGRPGEWRRYFTPRAAAWFEQEAGGSLRRDGYTTSEDWQADCRQDA